MIAAWALCAESVSMYVVRMELSQSYQLLWPVSFVTGRQKEREGGDTVCYLCDPVQCDM